VSDVRARLATALAGRYTIEREVGRGGMAIVYLAHDVRHERVVALKALRPELGAALGPDRFLREIKLAAHLAHPHVVPLFDSGDADGALFYVMPYVEGESLRQRLVREGRIPLAEALQIARDVADALDYAHAQNIVHRDIKPENILLQAGHAVVSDFGIARAISAAGGARVTGTGIAVGTPQYMSPEQASGVEEVDGRSDIYSLGCVLYEMLVGRAPAGETPPGTAAATRRGIPDAVEHAIARARAWQPEDRFQRAADFAAALPRAGARSSRHVWQFVRRRPWWAAAALLAAAGAGWGAARGLRPGKATGAASGDDLLSSATTSPEAVADLRRGKALFWAFDFDGAAAAYRRALAADSDAALAYHRLSVVETWRWDYPTALRVVDAGLARAARFSPKWRDLLRAQRHYVRREADSAIGAFQTLVADYPGLPDAWFGLGEALFHFAGFADNRPEDAEPALRRLLRDDASFAPLWEHLADLALYRGDAAEARRLLGHLHPNDRDRPGQEAAVALAFGDVAERQRTFAALREAERTRISLLAIIFGHGGAAANLSLVDTLGRLLLAPGRTHEDRVRGAQYRLIALAGQGRWADALAAWRAVQRDPAFDRWIVHAYLAGWPAAAIAEPMLARARAGRGVRVPEGGDQAPTDESQEAFRALVHRATIAGDSADVHWLLRRLAAGDSSDPMPGALRAALDARLALLARDTTRALGLLERSVDRVAQPFMVFYPMLAMGVERMLLAELYAGRGDTASARRWLDSFSNAWSFGDALYAPRVACVRRLLAVPRQAGAPPFADCVSPVQSP
jgi:tRNA A-37 threonylcarbamoyl transferase component Bud32/tetratricopeptide (TPR) repeat protein